MMQALRNLGPARLAVMGAVVMGLIGFFIYLTTRLAAPSMALLYGNLSPQDSTSIVSQLQSQGVPHTTKAGGTQIMVPSDRVLQLRMSMASGGMPSGGSVGYEIFDTASNLGTTSFVQNVNLIRALEGELGRTIASLDRVRSARVHLVLPKRQLFSRQQNKATASIILKMSGAIRLSKEQVMAVQSLVAAAVPGLVPQSISVIDNKGSLLASGFGEGSPEADIAAKSEQRKRSFENRMARTIEALLEKTVGFGNVRAVVTAEMDFDRISTTEEKFDPDGQVVRSTQTVEEKSNSNEADPNQQVSVASNLPDQNLSSSPGGASANTAQNRTEETVNFEISKRVINHVRETGIIKRLSVAIIVDGVRSVDANGDPVYAPRVASEMELLATLARSTVGFNADRGDSVDVINMQFAEVAAEGEKPLELFFGMDKNDMLRIAEFMVLGIVAILVILLVVRPLVSRAFEAIPTGIAVGPDGRLLEQPALSAPAPMPTDIAPVEEEQFDELIDIDRVEGRVKASSVKKVGEIVEKHPDEALSIIRSWMYQED